MVSGKEENEGFLGRAKTLPWQGRHFTFLTFSWVGYGGPFLRELLILEELRMTSRYWACEGTGWEMGGGSHGI